MYICIFLPFVADLILFRTNRKVMLGTENGNKSIDLRSLHTRREFARKTFFLILNPMNVNETFRTVH